MYMHFRPNIVLRYIPKEKIKKDTLPQPLEEYLDHVRTEQLNAEKAIVYCR